MPNKPLMRVPPFRKLRTKTHGLRRLKKLCKGLPVGVIPYRTYKTPKHFRPSHIGKPERILIRTDPELMVQSRGIWADMPSREVSQQDITTRQGNVRSKMRSLIEEWNERNQSVKGFAEIFGRQHNSPKLKFIVHPTRKRSQIKYSGEILFNLKSNHVQAVITQPSSQELAHRKAKVTHTIRFEIEKPNSVKIITSDGPMHMKQLAEKIKPFIERALQHSPGFEARFCTFKDAPIDPEFYDFLEKVK